MYSTGTGTGTKIELFRFLRLDGSFRNAKSHRCITISAHKLAQTYFISPPCLASIMFCPSIFVKRNHKVVPSPLDAKSIDDGSAETPLIKKSNNLDGNSSNAKTSCHYLSLVYVGLVLGIFAQLASFAAVFVLFTKFQSSDLCFAFHVWCVVETVAILSIAVVVSSLSGGSQQKVEALVLFAALFGLHLSFFSFAAMMELRISNQIVYSISALILQGLVSLTVFIKADGDDIGDYAAIVMEREEV